jgi:acyl-CoA thioesterase FadM
LCIDYEILRKNTNDLIAQGFTIHAFVNKQDKKVLKLPEFFSKAIVKFFQGN